MCRSDGTTFSTTGAIVHDPERCWWYGWLGGVILPKSNVSTVVDRGDALCFSGVVHERGRQSGGTL